MNKEVEKRILEMQFDNKQFESGVKETRDSIAKLNEDLKFKNANTGIQNVQNAFNRLDFSNLANSFENLKVRFSGIQVFLNRMIENISDTFYQGLGRIKSSITTVFDMIKTGGSNRALNIEQAKFQLEGLHVAWDDIKDDINYAVKDTAYGLDAAAKAASQLVASNIQVGEEMKYSLRGISGLAAMTNSTYEDIARIFTKVAGQGRLMGDDLNSIAARGINVAAELGKVFNVTEADIRDMVSKGAIDFKTFAKAMDDAFGQHAKDANKTYAGSLSNVKAALSRLGADIATTKFETLRNIFNDLIPKIDEFKKEFKPAEEAIQSVTRSIGKLIQTIIKNTDVPKIAKKISDAIVKVTGKIEYLIDQFQRAIKVVDAIEKRDSFKKIQNGVSKVASAVGDVRSELDKISDFSQEEIIDNTREYNKELRAAKDIVGGVYGELNGQARIDYVKDVLGLDPDTVQDYIDQVYVAGKTWDEVTLRAGDNADSVNDKYTKLSDTIKNLVKTFKAIKHVVKNIFTSIKNVAKVMIDSFTETFSSDLGGAFGNLPKTITGLSDAFLITEERAENLRPVFDVVFGIVKSIIGAIKVLFTKVKELYAWLKNNETVQKLMSSIKEFFKTVFSSLKDLKDGIANSDTFKKIKDTIKPITGEIGNFISFVLTGIANVFKRATDMVIALGNGKSLFDAISEFLFGTSQARTALYGLVKGGFVVSFIWLISKALYKMTLFANDGIFYIFRFLSVLSNFSRVLVTYKYYLRASAFQAVAKGIMLVVAAIIGMAYYINSYGASSVIEAALIIGLMITGLLAIMNHISKVDKLQGNIGGFIKASIVLRSLGLAILSVAGAVYFMSSAVSQYGWKNNIIALGIIMGTMAALIASLLFLSKMNTTMSTMSGQVTIFSSSLQRTARVLLAMSVSVLILSKALTGIVKAVKEGGIEADDLWVKGFLPLFALIAAMTTAIVIMSKFSATDIGNRILNRVALTIFSMGAAIGRISKALVSLLEATKDVTTLDLWVKGVAPLMVLMSLIVVAISTLAKVPTETTTLSKSVKTYQRVGFVILSVSIAMMLIVKAMASLLETCKANKVTTTELYVNGILPIFLLVGTVIGGLIAFSTFVDAKSNFFTPGKYVSLAVVIIGIAGSLSLIIFSLSHLLKTMKEHNIGGKGDHTLMSAVVSTLLIFGGIIGALIAIAVNIKGVQLLAISAAILIITTTMVAAMAAIGLITKVTDLTVLYGAVGVIALLIGLISVLGAGVAQNPQIAVGLTAMAGSILAFAGSLAVLSIAIGLADVAIVGLGIALPILASGVVETLKTIVGAILWAIREIPTLAEALLEAISSVAYSTGKAVPVLVTQLVRGFIDAINAALGINSPSKVFQGIGLYCIDGLYLGLVEGLRKLFAKIGEVLDTYIVEPVKNFFGIHSPSLLFIDIGRHLASGLFTGFDKGVETPGILEMISNKIKEKISGVLPETDSIGSTLGNNLMDGIGSGITDGIDMGQFDVKDFKMEGLGETIKESAAEQIRGINLTELYSLEDLLEDSSLYDLLKRSGETQLTAAYEEWQRHAEFLAKYPTSEAWINDMANNYDEGIIEAWNRALARNDQEQIDILTRGMLQNYNDQAKLDNITIPFMRSYKESLERAAEQEITDQTAGNITAGIVRKLQANAKQEKANYDVPAFVTMHVQDENGNSMTNGVQSLFASGKADVNLDYDNSSVKTNMDAVSGDISNAINAQTTKLENKLTAIETKVGTFDTNQLNRTNDLINRVDLLESAIRSMQLRLDTGALVGQLVGPMDDALGQRSVRKSRG